MEQNKRETNGVVGAVRKTDIEPYTALRWVGTLFKAAAVFLGVAILAEFVTGLRFEGMAALPILMGELARTSVMAVVLWGAGDLTRLLITVGNDIRAERLLLARLVYRTPSRPGEPDESNGSDLLLPESDAEEESTPRSREAAA